MNNKANRAPNKTWNRRHGGWKSRGGTVRGPVYDRPLGIVAACIVGFGPRCTLERATREMLDFQRRFVPIEALKD